MKTNTLCWLGLILLTITGVAASGTDHRAHVTLIILSAAWIKSGLVAWQFMELRTAHVLWKTGFLTLITGLVALLFLLA